MWVSDQNDVDFLSSSVVNDLFFLFSRTVSTSSSSVKNNPSSSNNKPSPNNKKSSSSYATSTPSSKNDYPRLPKLPSSPSFKKNLFCPLFLFFRCSINVGKLINLLTFYLRNRLVKGNLRVISQCLIHRPLKILGVEFELVRFTFLIVAMFIYFSKCTSFDPISFGIDLDDPFFHFLWPGSSVRIESSLLEPVSLHQSPPDVDQFLLSLPPLVDKP